MGLFGKFFKEKKKEIPKSTHYNSLSQNGSKFIRGGEPYSKDNKVLFESIIISFLILSYRLREWEGIQDEILTYIFKSNNNLKKTLFELCESILPFNGFKERLYEISIHQKPITEKDYVIQLSIYFQGRLFDYDKFFNYHVDTNNGVSSKFLLNQDYINITSESINIYKFLNGCFKEFYDIVIFDDSEGKRDFIENKNGLKTEVIDLMNNIQKCDEYIIRNFKHPELWPRYN